MSGSQVFVACFGSAAAIISIWAIWRVVKSPHMRHKPWWLAGSSLGFVGFSINWTTPGDLFMLFGIQLPVVTAYKTLATGQTIVKTAFPLIAVAALWKSRSEAVQRSIS